MGAMRRFFIRALEIGATVVAVLIPFIGVVAGAAEGGALGAVVGLLMAFIYDVLFVGVLFLLLEMHDNLRGIRAAVEQGPPRE